MADEQAEDRGGDAPHDHSDANSQQKAGSEDGSEEKNGEKKPSLLERFPIIRYVLSAALVAGILAAVVYFFVVKPYTAAKDRYFPAKEEEAVIDENTELLKEIRDSLRARPNL